MLHNELENRVHLSPAKFPDVANAVHGRTTSSRAPLAVAIERTMLVLATRLPYSSAQKSVRMRDRLLKRSDGGRAPHVGTRALTESGQQVAAKVSGIDCGRWLCCEE